MTRVAIALSLGAVLWGGCSEADEALAELARIKTAACACAAGDAACAAAAATKLAAWHGSYDDVDGSAAQAAKATVDLKAVDACLAKAAATAPAR